MGWGVPYVMYGTARHGTVLENSMRVQWEYGVCLPEKRPCMNRCMSATIGTFSTSANSDTFVSRLKYSPNTWGARELAGIWIKYSAAYNRENTQNITLPVVILKTYVTRNQSARLYGSTLYIFVKSSRLWNMIKDSIHTWEQYGSEILRRIYRLLFSFHTQINMLIMD